MTVGRTRLKNNLLSLLARFDLTEAFKTKGDLRRWSAKRTVGGVVVLTACTEAAETGITWPVVVMCFVGILPICLSFFEHDIQTPRTKHP